MGKIENARRRWSELRPAIKCQMAVLLAELGILALIWGKLVAIPLLLIAHIWTWKQLDWRRQDIDNLLKLIKQIYYDFKAGEEGGETGSS